LAGSLGKTSPAPPKEGVKTTSPNPLLPELLGMLVGEGERQGGIR